MRGCKQLCWKLTHFGNMSCAMVETGPDESGSREGWFTKMNFEEFLVASSERFGPCPENRLYRFENNYGVSVSRGDMTYGGSCGLFEVALVSFSAPGILFDEFVITNDVFGGEGIVGYVQEDEVQKFLQVARTLTNS